MFMLLIAIKIGCLTIFLLNTSSLKITQLLAQKIPMFEKKLTGWCCGSEQAQLIKTKQNNNDNQHLFDNKTLLSTSNLCHKVG